MNPITFSCTGTLPHAPGDIAGQILDIANWTAFTGYGVLPGIKTAVFEVRTPGVVGTRIRVTNTDGSSHVEEIVEWEPDRRLRLDMMDFSPPLARLATGFVETWEFESLDPGTRVVRSIEMHAKTVLTRPLLWLISFLLKRAIARHLANLPDPGSVLRTRSQPTFRPSTPMADMEPTAERLCIYCGGPATRIRDGEHIVPKAIGGAETIVERSGRLVCHGCNNGVLSFVDNVLCGRSYLALIASQELDASLWQLWDIDHAAGDQLVEAKPSWVDGQLNGIYCYPQMIFESGKPHIRCSPHEAAEYGFEKLESTLVEAMYDAYQRHQTGAKKRGLYFEPVEPEAIPKGCRLDPRVFTRHTIMDIAKKKRTFIVRYKSQEDKEAALAQLSMLGDWKKVKRWTDKPSSRVPTIANVFDFGQTLRGLVKIGVNLLAAFCTKTPVLREHFLDPIRMVRGEFHPNHQLFDLFGFVPAHDLSELRTDDKSHAFRLTYVNGGWHVYMSFFGGRLCAFVGMAGPNGEDWGTLDIVAPLKSKDWRLTYSPLILPIAIRTQWHDLKTLAPTIKLKDGWEKLTIEEIDPNE